MKKRILACVLFSLAFLLSCSDENLPSGDFKPLAKVQNTNRIDMQEATNLAEDAIAFLDREHPSESKSSRAVNSVSILRFGNLKSSMTKSGEYNEALDISDTLAYVFNFEDSLGFVIISNDKRTESPLLAFTQKGSLVNGETDNPGLKLFLERLEGYMLESIAKSSKANVQKSIAVAQKGPYTGSLNIIVKPLVPVEWGQGKPFNNDLANKGCYGNGTPNNGKVWAGCVATAVAQIMAYWKYPTSIGSTSYNWSLLTKYKHGTDFDPAPIDNISERTLKQLARSEVANLFQQIGYGIDMKYDNGCYESLAYTEVALHYLAYFHGFSLPNLRPYPYDTKNFIKVIVGLSTLKYTHMADGCYINAYGEKKCHAWVIDGLAEHPFNPDSYYVHNNWGWDGDANGYYASGVFDPSNNFQYDVRIAMVHR